MKTNKVEDYLAPITPGGDFNLILEWSLDIHDETVINGTWAEDGSHYRIICPPQLRNRIVAMQNLLPQFLDALRSLKGTN